jgi:hypothetical protein
MLGLRAYMSCAASAAAGAALLTAHRRSLEAHCSSGSSPADDLLQDEEARFQRTVAALRQSGGFARQAKGWEYGRENTAGLPSRAWPAVRYEYSGYTSEVASAV